MKKISFIIILQMLCLMVCGQPKGDPRSISLMGIPIEGPIDSLRQSLVAAQFAEWGQSDDGEDFYFRGNFYGFRSKLMVSVAPETKMVSSAYVTIGPYSTQKMLDKNLQYFLINYKRTTATSVSGTTAGSTSTTLAVSSSRLSITRMAPAISGYCISLLSPITKTHFPWDCAVTSRK